MKLRRLLLSLSPLLLVLLTGCAGTGEGGRLTPADTAQQLANLDRALQLAREARADYKDWKALSEKTP